MALSEENGATALRPLRQHAGECRHWDRGECLWPNVQDERHAIYWQDWEPGPAYCHLVRQEPGRCAALLVQVQVLNTAICWSKGEVELRGPGESLAPPSDRFIVRNRSDR